jgi:hypothetical protein
VLAVRDFPGQAGTPQRSRIGPDPRVYQPGGGSSRLNNRAISSSETEAKNCYGLGMLQQLRNIRTPWATKVCKLGRGRLWFLRIVRMRHATK